LSVARHSCVENLNRRLVPAAGRLEAGAILKFRRSR
jgi:hypothetical protein